MANTFMIWLFVLAGLIAGCLAASTSSPAIQREIVDYHNKVRKDVAPRAAGMKTMTWNSHAASIAQKYADQCNFKHSSSSSRSGMGENLAANTGSASWTSGALKQWADEKSKYRYPGGFSMATGHYTQMVWSDTTGVGCGYKRCKSNNPFGRGEWNFYVCNYSPAGNMNGQAPYRKA